MDSITIVPRLALLGNLTAPLCVDTNWHSNSLFSVKFLDIEFMYTVPLCSVFVGCLIVTVFHSGGDGTQGVLGASARLYAVCWALLFCRNSVIDVIQQCA